MTSVMRNAVLIRTAMVATLLLGLGVAVSLAQADAGATLPAPGGGAVALHWVTDYDQALAEAREAGRPVYVYIWARYNPDCVAMADNTLAYDAVMAQLAAFELVALDAHNRANFPFFDRYKIPYYRVELPDAEIPYEAGTRVEGAARYPTSLFLDPQGRELYRMFGFVEGKGFAVVLGRVMQVLKAWTDQRANPTSAAAEAQLGHLYMVLQVIPEARKHLEAALKLDPQNQSGLQPDIKLDMIIMGIPQDPGPAASLPALQQWQKQNAAHPRRLEAVYYEAVTYAALDNLDAAMRLLTRFKQAKPGSPEYESQWYLPALQLIAGINQAREPAPPTPGG
jgi:tetratricopeptide (TPR) repeat protein